MNRRQWLWLGGAALLEGCAWGGRGGGGRSWGVELLDEADGIARRGGARGWAAWEGGRLRKSWRTHERGPALSITKALAGLACARAAGEGWLDVEEPVVETIGEWGADAGKSRITVRMLLQMSAGLEGGAAALYRGQLADKGRIAIGLRQVAEPDRLFSYGPGCWEVLAELLHRKAQARGETLEGFMTRAVMRPIGLSTPEWRSDRRGRYYLSTGTELSVTELGRLGRVVGGLLGGHASAGIAAADFRAVTRPSPANPMFGGGLWWNRGRHAVEVEQVLDPPKGRSFWAGKGLSARQPSSMVMLVGSAGQRVCVWPDEGRVIARLGYSKAWRDGPLLAVV